MCQGGFDPGEFDRILLRHAKKDGRFGAFVISMGEEGLNAARVACSDSIRALLGVGEAGFDTVDAWLSLVEDRQDLEARIRQGMARSEPSFDRLMRVRRPSDGRALWVRLSAEMRRNPDGTGLQISGTVEDLSAGQEAADAEFKAALYSSQQESSLDGILVVGEGGRILNFNRRFAEMWRMPDSILRAGNDRAALSYALEQLRSPQAFLERVMHLYDHRDEQGRDTIEFRDGRIFDRYSAPVQGEDGRYFGRIWFFRDITESRKAEEALRLSESAFRNLFDFPILGVTVIRNRVFVKGSPGFVGRLGYELDEVIGRSARMFYADDEEFERAGHKLYGDIDSTGVSQVESRFLTKDGRSVDVIICARRLDPGDPEKGVVSIVLDVTAMKTAEREGDRLRQQLAQAQKMESIGRLAGGVAHDFNNLLTAIMGNAELAIGEAAPGDPVLSFLSCIMQAGESAAELTAQLLAFSRKQVINPRNMDLNQIIEQMKKMLVRIIGEDIDLRAAMQPGLPTISIDPAQIQQIILNLAVNARDAMPSGGCLTLETALVVLDEDYCSRHVCPDPGERVMLAISDTGHGMSAETQSHLFEPFFTTKPQGRGTGLGLAMVYGAVKQNGGVMDVYSELGRGTVFKIYFPPSGGPRASDTELIREGGALTGGNETVLLAEDNAMVLQFSLAALESLGYQVIAASSGEEALAKANAHEGTIDLLMTDIVMPRMNGKALAEALRVKRPRIKVLFCSGYTENLPGLRESLERGDEFIGKPFSAAALSRKLRMMLN